MIDLKLSRAAVAGENSTCWLIEPIRRWRPAPRSSRWPERQNATRGGEAWGSKAIQGPAMTPFRHYPKNITIATSSFKYVKLRAGFGSEGTTWIYANPEALVNAAVAGVFKPTARWDYWSQPREMRLASEQDKPLYDGAVPMLS